MTTRSGASSPYKRAKGAPKVHILGCIFALFIIEEWATLDFFCALLQFKKHNDNSAINRTKKPVGLCSFWKTFVDLNSCWINSEGVYSIPWCLTPWYIVFTTANPEENLNHPSLLYFEVLRSILLKKCCAIWLYFHKWNNWWDFVFELSIPRYPFSPLVRPFIFSLSDLISILYMRDLALRENIWESRKSMLRGISAATINKMEIDSKGNRGREGAAAREEKK